MAGWKDTAIVNPGTSTQYGADDLEMLMRGLNGITSGINSVEWKSSNKWGFWDNILYIRNQADSRNTRIRGQSNVPATDVDLALPPITTNDTLAAIGLQNAWAVVQQLNAGMIMQQMASPANPSPGFQYLFINAAGHLIRRNNAGVEINYDTGIAGLPAGSNKQIQYNNGGTSFDAEAGFEYDEAVDEATIPGLTLTQNLTLTGVISPAQITANTNNYNPTGLATSTTLRLTTDASRDLTGIAAQPSGTLLFIHYVGSFNLVLKDESSSSTSTNRFALTGDTTLGPNSTALLRYDGTTGRWRLVSSTSAAVGGAALLNAAGQQFVQLTQFLDGIEIFANSSDHILFTRDINTNNTIWGSEYWARDSANNWQKYGMLNHKILDNTSTSEDSQFDLTVTTAGTARILKTPPITADDTMASLGLAQTFTADKTFSAGVITQGVVRFEGVISPSQITSDQNDYAPTGNATAARFRLDADSNFRTISGIANGANGRTLYLENISNNTILLTNQDAGSTAANRFDFKGYDIPLWSKQTIKLIYDSTLSRWKAENLQALVIPPASCGYYYRNDMFGNVADHTVSSITSGTAAANSVSAVTSVAGHPGVVQGQTGSTSTGTACMGTTNFSTILLGNNWYWRIEAMIRIPTLSDGTNRFGAQVGFIDNMTSGAVIDGVYLQYKDDINSGKWRLYAINNNVTTNVDDTGTAVVANTWYKIAVTVHPNGTEARAFVDGVEISVSLSSGLPTGAGRGTGFGVQIFKTVGATARNLDIDYIEVIGYPNTVS